ncbi:hypothetical protein KCU65_g10156, partial [Aureobasidium melanogenum]
MPFSRPTSPVSVLDKEKAVEHIESALVEPTYLDGFPLLRDKSEEELAVLNKSVLKKLDWKFLPCITAMLLMNYLDRINVPNARLAGMIKI